MKYKDYNKTNLAWAIVWTIIAICTFIGMLFFNLAHWFTAGCSTLMAVVFYNEYLEHKD